MDRQFYTVKNVSSCVLSDKFLRAPANTKKYKWKNTNYLKHSKTCFVNKPMQVKSTDYNSFWFDPQEMGIEIHENEFKFFTKKKTDKTDYAAIVKEWCNKNKFSYFGGLFGARNLSDCAWCGQKLGESRECWHGMLLDRKQEFVKLTLGFHKPCKEELS